MQTRRALIQALMGLGLVPSVLAQSEEVILPVKPIQDRDYTLYAVETTIGSAPAKLILDTGSFQSWVDSRQLLSAAGAGLALKRVVYADGGEVRGPVIQQNVGLGLWQQVLPLLVAKTIQGPTVSVVQTIQRQLAQGLLGLGPGAIPGVRRVSLSLSSKRPVLVLNPSFYNASLTLPYIGQQLRVNLGQNPPLATLIDSGSAFVLVRGSSASRLGITPNDLAPVQLSVRKDVKLALVTKSVKAQLSNLYLRFDPPQVLVVQEAPPDLLGGLDLVLGVPFFEQAVVTWDTQNPQVSIGEGP